MKRCCGRSRFLWLLAAMACPSLSFAYGSVELRATGGPDGYGEWAGLLRIDPWEALGGEVEAIVSDDGRSSTARYYRGEVGVRTPLGVGADLGVSRSPAADGLRSEALYVDTNVIGAVWGDRLTAATVTWRRRAYGVRPLERWLEVEQVSWGVWVAQELSSRWVVSVEYTGYTYDRDLDRAALALAVLEFRRDRNLGFTVDRLAVFPDRVWGGGLDYRHPSGWWAGISWNRIVSAVELLEADVDRYGAEAGWSFADGLGTSVGLDLFVGRDSTDAYPYVHIFYDF